MRFLLTAFTALSLLGSSLPAQPQATPAAPPKSALFQVLALNTPVTNFFYVCKGKTVQLHASTAELSQLYESDTGGLVSVFRLEPSPDPSLPAKRVTLANLTLNENQPHLLVFTGAPKAENITVQSLEDSWKQHPEKTFRIVNNSKRNIAIQLGAEEQVIASGKTYIFLSAGSGYDFDFKLAASEDGKWVLRVQAPQCILPHTRATIIVSDPFPTPANPNPVDINMVTVFDAKQLTQ